MKTLQLACLFLGIAAATNAETIYLQDGTTVVGTVTSSDATNVVVKTSYGTARLLRSKIDRIEYAKKPDAAAAPAPAASTTTVAAAPVPAPTTADPAAINLGNRFLAFNLGFANPLATIDFTALGGGRDRVGTVGGEFDLEAVYMKTRSFGYGIEAAYMAPGQMKSTALVGGANTTINTSSFIFEGLVRWVLSPDAPGHAYLVAGLGLGSTSMQINSTPAPGNVWLVTGTNETRTIINGTSTGLATSFRAGFELPVNSSLMLGAETGFFLSSYRYTATSIGQFMGLGGLSGTAAYWTVSGRAVWRFNPGA